MGVPVDPGRRALGLSTLILVVIIPLFAYFYSLEVRRAEVLQQRCQVSNVVREQLVGLLDDLVAANKRRIEASGTTPGEAAANQHALSSYAARRERVLATVNPVDPDNPAYIDCEAEYPKPWPIG